MAARKAVVTVSIIGISRKSSEPKRIFTDDAVQRTNFIGPYLVADHDVIVESRRDPLSIVGPMEFGSMPNDGGGLLMSVAERNKLVATEPRAATYLRKFVGSDDAINGEFRYCLWIDQDSVEQASQFQEIARRIEVVRVHRLKSERATTRKLASRPYAFGEIRYNATRAMIIPRHSSEDRPYLPFEVVGVKVVIADSAISLDFNLHEAAIYAARLHLIWIATVCGKLETRYRYSNTLGWNTFPVPPLTEKNKADLTRCAENILLAREAHFPATIADLYDPENMPADLREAHDRNDETLERIYIGRRFRNDTERLEKLFELYTKMVGSKEGRGKGRIRERSVEAGS